MLVSNCFLMNHLDSKIKTIGKDDYILNKNCIDFIPLEYYNNSKEGFMVL